ncbi:hypothetical protein [Vannielia litorea]|uniref:Uncharacterized protein n=1 Tax=Vannielia litorea TaxID=1217970 RepID=A0A1N6H5J8_9RHOB|nr:hypothetical protein [Vannielia litorea]SIO14965.1 hypothetical protein SAMN05444002_3092 [Vannielia litorea]
MPQLTATSARLSDEFLDARITFHEAEAIMEADFSGLHFTSSRAVNRFYDRIEERIAATGEDKWFFLVNYSDNRIDPDAWIAFARRGRALNLAYSMGTVRFDVSEITRAQIERSAGTENFDANLQPDREAALARLKTFRNARQRRVVHQPNHSVEEIRARITFDPDALVMEVDFKDFTFAHSRDVDDVYDHIEERITETDRKWFFLVNYENCRIEPAAWVRYASRGKRLNLAASLGSVRYAPGSETEADIRLRSESQDFEPNIRNTRAEALERIAEMRAEAEASNTR